MKKLSFTNKMLLFSFLFLVSFFSFGQTNDQFFNKYRNDNRNITVKKYTSEDGLPQNQVLKIIEIANGNLIISTANGIARFDGQDFTDFIQNKEYQNSFYENIQYDEKNKQLFGQISKKQLKLLDPKLKWLFNSCRFTLHNHQLYTITEQGDLYVSDTKEINFKKIGSTHILETLHIQVKKSAIYIGSEKGLFKYDINQKKLTQLIKKPISSIKIFDDNQIYYLTNNSFESLDYNSNKTKIIFQSSEKSIILNDVEKIAPGDFYLGTSMGLYHINLQHQKKSVLLENSSEHINCIFYSKKNNCLFIGTEQRGLIKIIFKSIQPLFNPFELNANSISSVIEYQNKLLTIGSSGVIYDMSNSKNIKVYLKTKYDYSMLSNIDDQLLIGTWGKGIIVLKNKQEIKKIKGSEHFYDDYIHAIFKDSKNQIWAGSETGISLGENLATLKKFHRTDSYVSCFYELKDKVICVGTDKGFYLINQAKKTTKFIGRESGYSGKQVRSFYQDSQGKLWVGTYNGGLYCYYKNKLISINRMENSKLPKDIFCIAKNKENNMLYFTGNSGLYGINEAKLNDFFFKKSDFLIPFYFGYDSGLENVEFNGGFQKNYVKFNKNFYFPTIEGLVRFKPINHIKGKSKLIIVSVLVDDSIVPINSRISLTQNNSIHFNFSQANFNVNNLLFYQSKLEKDGEEQEWGLLNLNKSIEFNKLSHGSYKLKIRVLDSYNLTSPETIIYEFIVEPKFFQTKLFYLFMSILMLIIGGTIVQVSMKKHQIKIRHNNQVNNQILELKLSAIQARMNPHFIFNSLNSIKYFLLIENKNKAEKLINDFSTLLRKFLTYSDKQFIKVEEEISLILLYLNIENERFSDSFEVICKVDPSLNNETLPTLLIQPFIENSIKHGLSNIEHKGLISLSIFKLEDSIIIEIKDNGIGFNIHQRKTKQRREHISSGIKLVQDKIKNIKDKYGIEISLKIESQENKGTTVRLEILNKNDEMPNNRR